mgnify:CR=1 FL=1
MPLLPLFEAHENTDWLALPHFDAVRAERLLAPAGLCCPRVDELLVTRYVERFVASGYLPPPG